MRRIIEGKAYDTETATMICDLSPTGYSRSDFKWEDTSLYRSPKGQFFIAGQGNASSRWAERIGENAMGGGEGMLLIDTDDAKRLVERHAPGKWEAVFGEAEEG